MTAGQSMPFATSDNSIVEMTPEAMELLDLYTAEYRRRAVEEGRKMQGGDPADQIELNSIQDALDVINNRSGKLKDAKTSVGATLALVIGFACVVCGLAIAIIVARKNEDLLWVSTALLAAASVFVWIGFFYIHDDRKRQNLRRVQEGQFFSAVFLNDIDRLETAARKIIGDIYGSDVDTASLADILAQLENAAVWTVDDSNDFRIALLVRNKIVHETRLNVPSSDLAHAVTSVRRLSRVLESYESRSGHSATSTASEALVYERQVGDALRRIFDGFSVTEATVAGYDYLIENDVALIHVDVKYRKNSSLSLSDVMKSADRASNRVGPSVLVVTNGKVPQSTARIATQDDTRYSHVAVTSWNSPADDAILERALRDLSNTVMNSPSGRAAFEIYVDAHGSYRFRLKARNGEILAVSEGYSTRSDVLRSVEAVRGAVRAAEAVDRT